MSSVCAWLVSSNHGTGVQLCSTSKWCGWCKVTLVRNPTRGCALAIAITIAHCLSAAGSSLLQGRAGKVRRQPRPAQHAGCCTAHGLRGAANVLDKLRHCVNYASESLNSRISCATRSRRSNRGE